MANEEDFTFCSVGEPQKLADDVNNKGTKDGTSIYDDHNNSGSLWKVPSSQRESTVGSLSFKVIDASSAVDKRPEQTNEKVSGSSIRASPGPKAKPLARAKVPFEKGYSQVDWLRRTKTQSDLAGLKGQSNSRLIPLSEVKQHKSEGSMWTVLKGRVYNITPYMKFHPGGDELMKGVGRDCTSLFNKHHAWVNAEFLLEKCLVGILDDGKNKT